MNAYKKVLKDMVNSEVGLFVGLYDAKNGNEGFMNGIQFVMEFIADQAGDENFYDMFLTNKLISKMKVVDRQKQMRYNIDRKRDKKMYTKYYDELIELARQYPQFRLFLTDPSGFTLLIYQDKDNENDFQTYNQLLYKYLLDVLDGYSELDYDLWAEWLNKHYNRWQVR